MKNKTFGMMVLVVGMMTFPAFSQDGEEEKRPWTNVSELSAVFTGGNSESSTFSFKNDYAYAWDNANLTFKVGGFRAESVAFTRFAQGPIDNFTIVEDKDRQKTGENYFAALKYDKDITEKFFWFTGFNWDRNEFAGIKNRYSVSGGVGNIWVDTDTRKFRTDYGFQYTQEDLIFEQAGFDDSYASAIASYSWLEAVGKNSKFKQDFKMNLNLDETDDWRAELDNGFTTSISEKVALKVGLLLLFDNQPAFATVSLLGSNPDVKVPYELDDLDTVFTTSLVINF